MFERYTEKARRTIFFGRYEASQFGSPYMSRNICCLVCCAKTKLLPIHSCTHMGRLSQSVNRSKG